MVQSLDVHVQLLSLLLQAFCFFVHLYLTAITCRVWDVSDHAPIVSCPAPHPVRSLAFSPDGSLLAAGMQDGSFSVYSTR